MVDLVTLDQGRVCVAGLLVYPERAVAAAEPLSPGVVPRPHGVAPTAIVSDEVVCSVAEGEVVWLGFQPVDRHHPQTVRVRIEGPELRDAITGQAWESHVVEPGNHLVVPPDTRLVGVPGADGVHPFVPPVRLSLLVGASPVTTVVDLVTPTDFERLTGRKFTPLDRRTAYTGWRAP